MLRCLAAYPYAAGHRVIHMDTSLSHVDVTRRDAPVLPIFGCIIAAALLTAVTLIVAHYVFNLVGLVD
jgi:small neutral amino acid transporter SnatA (MarC family)